VEFVNADAIAVGLSSFQPETVAIHAGRIMLKRLHELVGKRVDFAFESTLASRSFAPWISELKQNSGYSFYLIYLWLPSPEMAVARVRERVSAGGHGVPEDVVRRRYAAGLRSFFGLCRPLADGWSFYDNSAASGPRLIAMGEGNVDREVHDPEIWAKLSKESS
jgi:predicted ABC-type ATPase